MKSLEDILNEIKKCNLCVGKLPFEPNPVLKVSEKASLRIIGQAPGLRAHLNKLSWSDNSGDRLRSWLGLDKSIFYDQDKVAITSMGFCYPGTYPKGGDKPPRSECAKEWHSLLNPLLPNIKLTLLIGAYAQKYYLGNKIKPTLTETVRAWQDYMPNYIPLPHPSWRNIAWLKKNQWFEEELLPELKSMVKELFPKPKVENP